MKNIGKIHKNRFRNSRINATIAARTSVKDSIFSE